MLNLIMGKSFSNFTRALSVEWIVGKPNWRECDKQSRTEVKKLKAESVDLYFLK